MLVSTDRSQCFNCLPKIVPKGSWPYFSLILYIIPLSSVSAYILVAIIVPLVIASIGFVSNENGVSFGMAGGWWYVASNSDTCMYCITTLYQFTQSLVLQSTSYNRYVFNVQDHYIECYSLLVGFVPLMSIMRKILTSTAVSTKLEVF